MKLQGKVAIVAGGGQGIGEGCVRCLAEEGADVAVVDINGDTAKKVADEVRAMGREALPIAADLTDENQVTKTVQDSLDFFGKIDILVNNVGGSNEETRRLTQGYRESLGDDVPQYMYSGPDVWDNQYRLNLKAHVMMSHAVTPHFTRQRSGKIVNISSTASRLAAPTLMPYSSLKAGVISITWSLARALASYNVTVNCICPGHVYTPLWERGAIARLNSIREAKAKGQDLPPQFAAEDIEQLSPKEFWLKYIVIPATPLGRDQTTEDMGRAVIFFVSEDAKNITGQVLNVDGGQVMR